MKNTLKIMLLLFALATLGSCVKESVKRRNIAPKQNELIYNTTNYKMSVSPIESCQDEFDIVTESEMDFFGPLMRFHFYGIPSVLLASPLGCLCWPQTFKELSASLSLIHSSPILSESGCKSTAFSLTRKHFFRIFFIFLARG